MLMGLVVFPLSPVDRGRSPGAKPEAPVQYSEDDNERTEA